MYVAPGQKANRVRLRVLVCGEWKEKNQNDSFPRACGWCKGTLVGVGDGLDEEQEQDERHRRQELDAGRRPTSQLVYGIKIEIINLIFIIMDVNS